MVNLYAPAMARQAPASFSPEKPVEQQKKKKTLTRNETVKRQGAKQDSMHERTENDANGAIRMPLGKLLKEPFKRWRVVADIENHTNCL